VAHGMGVLTVAGRLLLVTRVLVDGWSVSAAAQAQGVSRQTVYRWVRRFRVEGESGLVDRSCRPVRSPRRCAPMVEERVCELRRVHRWGPHRISYATGIPRSTVYRILCRAGLNRLEWFDRPTGIRVRRYERARPGELLHVDTKRIPRIPDGGGWRFDPSRTGVSVGAGYEVLHTCVDDHSRVAYVETHRDAEAATTAGFLRRAVAFYRKAGITVEAVMTDNAWSYVKSTAFNEALNDLNLRHVRIPPRRPQTNGKVERFHRTLKDEWAYARHYPSNTERQHALDRWIIDYNYTRPHTSLGGQPPASRL
jgi:transposase InsO family protein